MEALPPYTLRDEQSAAGNALALVQQQEPLSIKHWTSKDEFIAIMGVTGAGKSTFISQLTDSPEVTIGHNLRSETKYVSHHEYRNERGRTIWLIDTPGFDDTFVSDVEILKQIVLALSRLYEAGVRMAGMIYLHRISDPKMGRSSIIDLEIFKKLCGSKAMPIVTLVTTRWDQTSSQSGNEREEQLKQADKFWAGMISAGAKVERHENIKESAERIIETILKNSARPALAIQEEVINLRLSLADTSAGKVVVREQKDTAARYRAEVDQLRKEQQECLAAKDYEMSEELAKELQKQEALQANVENAQRNLGVDFHYLVTEGQHRVEDEPPTPGISRRPTLSEDPLDELQVQIDILKQNIADLQDESERKEKLHAEQLRTLKTPTNPPERQTQASNPYPLQQAVTQYQPQRAISQYPPLRTVNQYPPQQANIQSTPLPVVINRAPDWARQAAVISAQREQERILHQKLAACNNEMRRRAEERRRRQTERLQARFFHWLLSS